ncbi:MAG TPA: hypothetical protein VHW47_07150, partial [Acidimicrobiales bacterium]|nr:hypothetical protein [Acidimicrobiales bacterium]
RPAKGGPSSGGPVSSGPTGAVPADEELEEGTEDELDEADQLVEVMEDGLEAMIADEGDPGPTEPQGLF